MIREWDWDEGSHMGWGSCGLNLLPAPKKGQSDFVSACRRGIGVMRLESRR